MPKVISAESSADVSAQLKAKLFDRGFNQRTFAQWAEMDESWVSRLLGGRHDSQISTLINLETKIDDFLGQLV